MKALAQGEPKLHCFRQKEEALLGPGQASHTRHPRRLY